MTRSPLENPSLARCAMRGARRAGTCRLSEATVGRAPHTTGITSKESGPLIRAGLTVVQ